MVKVCSLNRRSLNLVVFNPHRNPHYIMPYIRYFLPLSIQISPNQLDLAIILLLGWTTWYHLDCIWRKLVHWHQSWQGTPSHCRACFQCLNGSFVFASKINLYHALIGWYKGTISTWIWRRTRTFLWTCSIYSWKQVTWTRFECHCWRCSSNGLKQGTVLDENNTRPNGRLSF